MSDELIFQYPAKVRRVDNEKRDALIQLARESNVFDESIFEERTPFFWTAEISNDQVDAHHTHMLDGTLSNFAADSRAGVAFLNSHRHYELPFGRSLSATIEENEERKRVITEFFTLPGLNLNGVTTDDFIAGVRSGIVSDVSVGFHGGEWWCDICGGDYRRYQSCPHFAGTRVETKEGFVVCTVGIDNARLSEVSAVYDGSTPDATILKAQRMAAVGELDPKLRATIEARYRTRLPEVRSFAGADMHSQQEDGMDYEKLVGDMRSALGVEEDALIESINVLVAENERLSGIETEWQELSERVKDIEPLAEDGRTYREDMVTQALAEGVRAYGDKFDNETYETMLRSASLEVIKRMKDDWQAIGDSRFVGGRQTTDEGEPAPDGKQRKRVHVPDAAYRV